LAENRSFSGSGRARGASKPPREVGGEAPHLFGWFSKPPGAAQTPKRQMFSQIQKPPLVKRRRSRCSLVRPCRTSVVFLNTAAVELPRHRPPLNRVGHELAPPHVSFVFLNDEDLGARSCGRVDLGGLTRQHQRDLWTEWRSSIWEVRMKLLYLKKRLKISVLARAAV